MYGRDAELSRALGVLDVQTRSGSSLLISGEAGIGKTALLQEVANQARRRGLPVLAGGAHQLEADLSFAAVANVLGLASASDRGSARLRSLLSERAGAPGTLRLRLLEELTRAVVERADAGGVLVILDDAHWADPDSLAVMDRLVARTRTHALSVLVSLRDHPRRRETDALRDRMQAVGAGELRLGPLDEDASVALAMDRAGAVLDGETLMLVRQASGNPLLIESAVRGRGDEGYDGLTSAVRARVDELSPAARELVAMGAAWGRPFQIADLAAAVERSVLDVIRDIDDVIAAEIFESVGERLGFRHALIREVVADEMPTSMRLARQRQVLDVLTARDAVAAERAPIAVRIAEVDPSGMLESLRTLASELAPRAPAMAVRLLDLALTAPGARPVEVEVRAERAWALLGADRFEEALDAAHLVLAGETTPDLRVDMHQVAAEALRAMGAAKRALDELDGAARAASVDRRAGVMARIAHYAAVARDVDRVERAAREALALARKVGDDRAAGRAYLALAMWEEQTGSLQDSVAYRRLALEHVDRTGEEELLQLDPFALIASRSDEDRAEALQVLQTGLRLCEERGLVPRAARYQLALGTLRHQTGDWDEAVGALGTTLAIADELLEPLPGVETAAMRYAHINIHRGDLDRAGRLLDRAAEALDWLETPEHYLPFQLHRFRAQLAEAEGDLSRALTEARSTLELLVSSAAAEGPALDFFASRAVPLALRGGDPTLASALIEQAARREGRGAERPDLALARAVFDGDARAAKAALEAIDARASAVFVRAEAREDAATAVAASGDREEAIGLLREAHALWVEMGASAALARIIARIRNLGGSPPAQAPDADEGGWALLTPTEKRVVALVADGLIYRDVAEQLFVSRRTVETHVANVFRKLGINSRRELADLYAQWGNDRA